MTSVSKLATSRPMTGHPDVLVTTCGTAYCHDAPPPPPHDDWEVAAEFSWRRVDLSYTVSVISLAYRHAASHLGPVADPYGDRPPPVKGPENIFERM